MKFFLHCSIAALLGVVLAEALTIHYAHAQGAAAFDVEKPIDGKPSRIEVRGGVSGVWLTVERANKHQALKTGEGGFDPSYTYLICDFKPMVKKLGNGKWVIQFTAEIAEDLP